MQIVIKGRNMEMTSALREYAERKVRPLERHFGNIMEVQVIMSINKNPSVERNQDVELSALVNGVFMGVEEHDNDMYRAIDKAVDKLSRQVNKYKERIQEKADMKYTQAMSMAGEMLKDREEEEEEALQARPQQIVKRKSFLLKPMFPEDAAIQMEELGHAFFVFRNAETESINVIYRRRDGDYGLIETR
ncbi:MAG: ribosome-associated translation inhibitor RaiA [bacterium]|jgi:putative sigma-54 modulation protein|nr:ribosome-associated translation inhibitor RaiA [bacterium]MDD3805722.1 ribosome-associated translation inhibitor RaiA [bacterium]MDD4558819.1 ribosome-associated translation inhibitor RaiA [bacterium]